MSIINIFNTARGSQQAEDPNGFRYHLNRKLEKVTYWRCSKKDCNVRLISRNSSSKLDGEVLPHHEHTTNILKDQAKTVEKAFIKKYATLPRSSTKAMLCEISQNILGSSQPNALYSMSSTAANKMALLREKRKLNPLPPLPKNYSDVLSAAIPSTLTNTADNTEFMILNCWTNDMELEGLMVFLSDVGADILRRSPVWMLDGTFGTAPAPYYQVYVIMGKFATGKAIPCGWSLLPNKKEESYAMMLDAIMRKVNRDGAENYKPNSFSVDFEMTVIKQLRNRFPGVHIDGCAFHMRQAIWRKLQELGLTSFFHQDGDFQELVHMVYALAYVPVDKITEYYEKVILVTIEEKMDETDKGDENDDNPWDYWRENLDAFENYLDFTWIGKLGNRSGRRGRPHIAYELYSQFEAMTGPPEVSEARCSTNNCLERYNLTLKNMLGKHPNLWAFIRSIIGQEADARRVLMHNATGVDLTVNPGRDQSVRDHHDKILSIMKRFADLTPSMYMHTLAKLIIDK